MPEPIKCPHCKKVIATEHPEQMLGFPVYFTDICPEDEVWFVANGVVQGVITNLGKGSVDTEGRDWLGDAPDD